MPQVSIIVPCFNEENTIGLLLEALVTQTFPIQETEVIIADGLSSDATRQRVAEFQQEHPDLRVRVVDNVKRTIPAGLNTAIAAAQGEFLVRLDAHSMPQQDYVARCVEALQSGKGDNVGGVWQIRAGGPGWQAGAIAAAAAHPLGVGDAHYRFTAQAQWVDTVPFGAFRRDWVARIGPFNEDLLTNEDYEFNVRLRQAGGKVWLDPSIRSVYFARSNLAQLARQYWRYGYWKARMLRRYPGTIRWRQALPPVFVLSLIGLPLLALFLPCAGWAFVLELAIYTLILLAAGIQLAVRQREIVFIFGVPLAIATMHVAWGSAFLWSLMDR
ncbi:MAG: glycosyltransferase family 2 protein [Chloroflexota bacterium]